jgi:hypothetical protein
MIPASRINAVISGVGVASGLNLSLADQGGHKPAYPYLSWKVISSQEEGAHQDVLSFDHDDYAGVERYEQSKQVLSLTCISQDIQDLWARATLARQWFKSDACRSVSRSLNIAVNVLGGQIEDRTLFLDTYFENRLGFDIRLDYYGTHTDAIEDIGRIEVTPTVDEVVESTIIIEEET